MDEAATGRSERGTVVVLGGYGAVGRSVARTLAQWFPGEVVVAGRDGAKAAAMARSSGGAIAGRQVDVTRPDEVDRVIDGAGVVVMCIEHANEAVARACLTRGIHFVDISATEAVLSAITRLEPLAREHHATAVLSVGLAPGVTNLLARHCHAQLPAATTIDITLIAGVNGDHGPDSLRWIADNFVGPGPTKHAADRLRRTAIVVGPGPTKHAAAVAGPRPLRVDLPGFGTRTAYPFAFSDQHTVSRALGVRATTRLAFESATLTTAIFALRTAGFFRLLRGPRARRLLAALLSRVRFGTDRFVVQARATDADGRQVSLSAAGREESRATGVVAAHVARLLRAGNAPAGVVHIDDIADPAVLLRGLEQHGITLHADRVPRATR
jgi:saccharopine dehydrogenase-like NADP-dependent oxidoreductase